jgi:Putative Flp pilus-assembly TadE/G-like
MLKDVRPASLLSKFRLGRGANSLLGRLLRDKEGSILVYMTLVVPALIGIAGLGAEASSWLYTHRVVQSAADNAAYSAAAAYAADKSSDLTTQAKAITAHDYNLVDGVNGVTVVVNHPPLGTCYSGTSHFTGANAIEVIVTQPRTPLLSKIWISSDVNICGRAVAVLPNSGDCILALGATGTGIGATKNNLNIRMTDCSIFSNSSAANSISITGNNSLLTADAIGAVGGINLNGNQKTTIFNPSTGNPPVPDPYATDAASWPQSPSTSPPTTCPSCGTGTQTAACMNGGPTLMTLFPGTFASAPNINNKCTTVTMNSGTYVFSAGLNIPSGVTLNIGAGSTIIIPATTTAGLTNNGTINFGNGNNSIYIGARGWTDNVTHFGSGNFSMAIAGGWTATNNLTMGTGSFSVSVTGDFTINGGGISTLAAGIYYISGNLNITGSGGQAVNANNVTLALTGASSIINYTSNNATLTLTAPTTGWNQGIAVWEPNSTGNNLIATGNSAVANITGVIYTPKASVDYEGNTGNTSMCTQIVAKAVSFGGNSINISGDCSTVPGMKVFGQIAALVE